MNAEYGSVENDPVNHRPCAKPVVSGDSCVHGRSPISSCRACVIACPRMAFSLDDDGLGFDAEACDGCGLCAAACPETAIDLGGDVTTPLRQPSGGARAFVACEFSIEAAEAACVSCLHAVPLSTLAKLYSEGVRAIYAARADCSACSRNAGPTLADRVSDLTRLVLDRGLEPMKLETLPLAEWKSVRDESMRMSRRSLFRSVFGGGMPSGVNHEDNSGVASLLANEGVPAPGVPALLPQPDKATLSMTAPLLDAGACVACGACIEVCSHGVIRLTGITAGAPRYEVNALGCTGCGLCADGCEVDAITLAAWGEAVPPPTLLKMGQCRSCSSPYYAIAGQEAEAGLCRICSKKSGNNKLFQVLP